MEYKLYTVVEAAKLVQLHPKTLRRKIREGLLQSTRVGKQYRITQEQLEEFSGQKLSASKGVSRYVTASSVVDIEAISLEEYSRINNTLMAVLNSNQRSPNNSSPSTRVDCLYYEEIGKLKIVLYGDIETTQELLKLIDALLSTDNN